MPKKCLFCDTYKEGKEVVWENEFFYMRFDKFPITPGHSEIIPKKHIISLLDLTKEEWGLLKPAIENSKKIIESTDLKNMYKKFSKNYVNEKSKWFCEQMLNHIGINKKPDAYNFGNNDGEAAGRTIHHMHFHIIPRYNGDVEDPRGGIRYIIPEYGNYK